MINKINFFLQLFYCNDDFYIFYNKRMLSISVWINFRSILIYSKKIIFYAENFFMVHYNKKFGNKPYIKM